MTSNTYRLVCVLSAILSTAMLSSCSKRETLQERVAKAIEERSPLDQELETQLSAAYSEATVTEKSLQKLSPVLQANISPLLPDARLSTHEDLQMFFASVPTASKESLMEKAREQARELISEKYNLLSREQLVEKLKQEHPLLAPRAKVSFISLIRRKYQGMFLGKDRNVANIGGHRISKDDIPMDIRVQIWEEDRDAMVDTLLRTQLSDNLTVITKNMDATLKSILPKMLLEAGYIPDFSVPGATLHSIDLKDWFTRGEVFKKAANSVRRTKEQFISQFWESKGYKQFPTPSGQEWLPQSFKK